MERYVENQLFATSVSGTRLQYNDLSVHFIVIDYNAQTTAEYTPMHVHDFYEFYMLLDGKQYTTVRDCEFVTSQHEFFLVSPGVEHGHHHIMDRCDEGIQVRFHLEKRPVHGCRPIADRVIQALSTTHPHAFHDRQIEQLLMDAPANASVEQLHLRMLQWILRLYEVFEADVSVACRRTHPTVFDRNDLVGRVIITINTLFMTDLSVKDVAKSHNISYRHLSRLFLKRTGYTMVQAIIYSRLRNAAMLLRDTALPVREVARRSGFRNEAYFTHTFTKLVGQSPSAYRVRQDPSEAFRTALKMFDDSVCQSDCARQTPSEKR